MKFILALFVSLAIATPVVVERQFGGGGQSFACQHDHLHMNPDCTKGASGAAKSAKMPGAAAKGKMPGGAGAGRRL
ncbi:hypothetical protein EJ08DRAFT_692423 [Tothia fuscella]|uniref:Uncharacterized protein n=1 Tax=Tothia fuscella TaxID=1048955 RepID=A0A9P4P0B8_9PEZI|nr:hypothetical protein EJ08DRAFT_692423 [Tothia fuscella]